jgi:integrative and conjugative element protein (TIGR02256 family)
MASKEFLAWLPIAARDEIVDKAQRAGKVETGGILLGYWAANSTQPVICNIVGPGPKADHQPTRFRPDQGFHLKEIARAYRESNGSVRYLGDWHSHPQGTTELSARDVRTLGRISRYAAARVTTPLMLITAGPPWAVEVWLATRPLCRIWPRRSDVIRIPFQLYHP